MNFKDQFTKYHQQISVRNEHERKLKQLQTTPISIKGRKVVEADEFEAALNYTSELTELPKLIANINREISSIESNIINMIRNSDLLPGDIIKTSVATKNYLVWHSVLGTQYKLDYKFDQES